MGKYHLNDNRYFSNDSTVRNYAHQIYDSIKNLPIVSPHGHVDPKDICR